jgi:hypothetical protein
MYAKFIIQNQQVFDVIHVILNINLLFFLTELLY